MKRKVPVAVAKGILAKVPFHVSFWLCTNENLRSLADVFEALQKASDDVFRYHVNRDKNDFEVWIRDIIKDKDLAREIARVKTRETLIRKISERVDELRTNVKKGMKKPKSSRVRLGPVAAKRLGKPKARPKGKSKRRPRARVLKRHPAKQRSKRKTAATGRKRGSRAGKRKGRR